jgi:hypothetical protein
VANFTTSQDIINDALFRANEPIDGSSDYDSVVVTYLNRAYQSIWSGGSDLDPETNEVWWWLRKDGQGVVTLNPVQDDGSVSVTNNSTSITFSSPPAASMTGRHFKVNDHADVFIITAHTAGAAAATLESVYTGTTNASASFRAMQFDYTLNSDILYLTSPFYAFQDNRRYIPVIALDELQSKWPLETADSGVPRNAAFTGQDKVRFSHFGGRTSTDLIKLNYEYIFEPADLADDTNEPLVPRQYRKVLADWTLMLLLSDKDDPKVQTIALAARNGIIAMAEEHRRRIAFASGTENYGRIYPRLSAKHVFRGPLRTETGVIISGR